MAEQNDTPLGELINRQITLGGPVPLSTYMSLCLTHPEWGYYTNQKPLGAKGDFITAPDISQMFGEMIGIWMSVVCTALGNPKKLEIVELGPGRGTLMQDALRVFHSQPNAPKDLTLTLVETNPHLRKEQAARLDAYAPKWIGEISEIGTQAPDRPLIMIANEFFDALPIRQFQHHQGAWHEREIGLIDGERRVGLSPTPIADTLLEHDFKDAGDHEVFEVASTSAIVMEEIVTILKERAGTLLALDYGYTDHQTGETFQALAQHKHVDPLARPGEADLTTHVNFLALAEAANKAGAWPLPFMSQAEFLKALGIEHRATALSKANPSHADNLVAGMTRLIAPDQMGDLFKVLCVSSPNLAIYPFVEPESA